MVVETVSVVLTNHQAYLTDYTPETGLALRDFWSFMPPGAIYSKPYKLYVRERARAIKEGRPDDPIPGWDGKIRVFKNGTLPAGLFRATYREAEEKLKVSFNLTYKRPKLWPLCKGFDSTDPDYLYQNTCVTNMLTALKKGGGIVLAATGSGKTKISAQYFSKVPYTCLFVVDQLNLLYQSQTEIAHWLKEPVGVVGDSEYNVQRITVATIQTLDRHLNDPVFAKWYRSIQIVFVDELHEQLSRRNFSLLEKVKPLARYGLTATLQLTRKPVRFRAYSFAGPVLYTFPIAEAMEKKVATTGSAVQLLFREMYDWAEPDYQEEYKHEVVENEVKLRACKTIVSDLIQSGRYVIVLVQRVAHLLALHEMFSDTPHRLAYKGVKQTTRVKAQARFEKGGIRLFIANQVFKKGVNIKRVDVIYDLAEMKSKNDVLQKFGRGVRRHQDKQNLLYIDGATRSGRFHKAAKSRARALTVAGISVTKVKVDGVDSALKAVQKFYNKAMEATK